MFGQPQSFVLEVDLRGTHLKIDLGLGIASGEFILG